MSVSRSTFHQALSLPPVLLAPPEPRQRRWRPMESLPSSLKRSAYWSAHLQGLLHSLRDHLTLRILPVLRKCPVLRRSSSLRRPLLPPPHPSLPHLMRLIVRTILHHPRLASLPRLLIRPISGVLRGNIKYTPTPSCRMTMSSWPKPLHYNNVFLRGVSPPCRLFMQYH